MSTPLLIAQVLAGGGIASWAIWLIIVAAIVGIVLVVARQAGVVIPQFVILIAWILLAAFVGIVAIRFLLSMA